MTGDVWTQGGATALRSHAPAAGAALDRLAGVRPSALDPAWVEAIRAVTPAAIGLPAAVSVAVGVDQAVTGFAEQFAVDVTRIDDDLRAEWLGHTGAAAFDATLTVYVADWAPRVRRALDDLFGAEPWPELSDSPVSGGEGYALMDDFQREVAMLTGLDDVLTERVRLHGAEQHQCRLRLSRRSRAAVEAGLGDEPSADHLAVLGLVEALIWTPSALPAGALYAVRAHLTPAQAVELVLDVARNATNKIAVALAADAPEITEGVQYFDLDAAGRTIVG